MRKLLYILILFCLVISACKRENDNQAKTDTTVLDNQTNIPVGKGPDALFLTPDKKKLYVANVEDTTISIIGTENEKVAGTISGIRYPWGFSRLGSSNEVAVSAYDKQVAIIDFSTDKVVREKTYSSHLGGITTDSIGQYLYVVAIDAKKVLKIDAVTLDSLDSYDTGNGPDGVGISKDNQKLYVTNTKDGTISIVNMQDKTVSLFNTGGKPELVHPNHDHSILYISNFFKNKIHVINTVTDSIIHEITGLDGPEEAVPTYNDEKLYVVNFNPGKVYVYEIPGYTKQANEYSTGNKPIGVIPVNHKLYVTNYGDNTVSVIKK